MVQSQPVVVAKVAGFASLTEITFHLSSAENDLPHVGGPFQNRPFICSWLESFSPASKFLLDIGEGSVVLSLFLGGPQHPLLFLPLHSNQLCFLCSPYCGSQQYFLQREALVINENLKSTKLNDLEHSFQY